LICRVKQAGSVPTPDTDGEPKLGLVSVAFGLLKFHLVGQVEEFGAELSFVRPFY